MLIRPFYAFFSLRGRFLLIGAPRPFYAYQSFLCLSVRTVHFLLVRLFYAYQRTIGYISCLSLWKKNEIDLSRNDPFFESGLSGLIFLSRQKNKRSLLGLPVLFVVFPLPSKMPKSCSAGNSPKSGKRTCGGSGKWSVPKTLFMICVFYAQTVWPSESGGNIIF